MTKQKQGGNRPLESLPATTPSSRRNFLKGMGAGGLAAASGASLGAWARSPAEVQPAQETEPGKAGTVRVSMTINGQKRELQVAPNVVLLDALRHDLKLTGAKKGCDHGQCGACNVHVNGRVVNSCLSLAVMHEGDEITTVEGLGGANGELGPLQQAFHEHDAYQCGYCTSGQMMTAAYVLRSDHIAPDDASVREAMSGNICRCGAYKNILAAVQSARGKA